jgi:tetratricopeptide (TPR) repeat protein
MNTGRRTAMLTAAVVAVLAATAFWFYPRGGVGVDSPPAESDVPPDPRLTYDGPLQNVHPSVGYAGDAKCAECHLDITLPYSDHPMGRSLVPIRDLARYQPYDKAHNTPFDALGARLWAEREGDRARHRAARLDEGKPVWEMTTDVHFAVGSGTRGYSYFTELDGFVFQTPISWFSQKGIWDLSPGFQELTWPGRVVPTPCLQCHANGVKQVEGHLDRFEPGVFAGHAIGCERCHGPGQKHVEARERSGRPEGGPDGSIVNPSRLEWPLRENVCEQCHLGGVYREPRRGRGWFDYRPGTALEDFLFVLVKNPNLPGTHLAVGQVEQMRRSRCFQKSEGKKKLGCVSCHDPHQRFEGADAVRHFKERCLACHKDRGCSEPEAKRLAKRPDDSCVACHMPRAQTADIAHTALTDHSVPRTPRPAAPGPPPAGALPFVPFHPAPPGPGQDERRRDLAVALIKVATRGQMPKAITRQVVAEAAATLEARLPAAPTDPEGWESLAQARILQRRPEMALPAVRRASALMPLNDRYFALMGQLELERGREEEGLRLWGRAAEIRPYELAYRRALTVLHDRLRDWAGAAEQARAWVRFEPDNPDARQLLTRALLEQGRRDEARRAFDGLRALKPDNLGELEAWYRRQAK